MGVCSEGWNVVEHFHVRIKRRVERCKNYSSENKSGGSYAGGWTLTAYLLPHIKYTPHDTALQNVQNYRGVSTGTPYTTCRLSTPHPHKLSHLGTGYTQHQSYVPAQAQSCVVSRYVFVLLGQSLVCCQSIHSSCHLITLL